MSAPGTDFTTFVQGLTANALLHLGVMPHPETNETEPNLPLASHTIDLLSMLEEKTRGNLSEAEQHLLTKVLYDLRLRYVGCCEKSSS